MSRKCFRMYNKKQTKKMVYFQFLVWHVRRLKVVTPYKKKAEESEN